MDDTVYNDWYKAVHMPVEMEAVNTQSASSTKAANSGASNLDFFSLEMFENIAYVMSKHADAAVPDTPEEWLDGFNTFSIYQVLPEIIELLGLNLQTDASAKKKFGQQTGR